MDSSSAFIVNESEESSGMLKMLGFRNRMVMSVFIIKIVYSTRKKRANGPAEYFYVIP